MRNPAKNPLLIAGAVLIAGAAVLLFVLGRGADPAETSAEAGFARDMSVHHAQAVDMSFIIRDKTQSKEIRNLAFDIITTQSTQRGMFIGWLEQWGLGLSTDLRPMAWMHGHGHGAATTEAAEPGVMPGMAGAAELAKLKELQGTEAEVLFLQLMIRHHEGGVRMAEGLLKLSDRDEVVNMAQKIVKGQSGEIKLMTDMLGHRGAQP
ncbi:DUF305 domain-containing protein [Nonomuraea cavernae]|uniref:DUF305 domain-containing protein n=1 Tax=Nonomuraea cavernae TaxID=2045107 RepID=A0A917Z592_9ACTN|nr:DUF305 domain-containing protein [Nonomuraea cavernae]MCA2188398.1 DUF305 domain-containing protein [Nonomuraea cavernae]GGO73442.1 DUF305 domain-containing protein [Nonomuraea cavernae]